MADDKRMVGRERERELLGALLADVAGGQGEAVFVAGEPGIGKTRLMSELARLACEAGMRVAWGRASESGGAPALWPWQEALRELMRQHGREAFVAAAGGGLPFVARLLPGLGAGVGSEIEAASAQFQLFDAVTRLVCDLAPVVLFLDDLHAADMATLLLLAHAAPAFARRGVLLVGSFRPEDLERAPERARILWSVVREATHLPLGRLSEDEARRLLEAVLGRRASAEEQRVVLAATEGSPLFVHEYARLLRARGALPPSLPPAIRHALEARIERLPAATQAALAAVSVLGRELSAPLVARLGIAGEALAPALLAGILVEQRAADRAQPSGPALEGWSFSHILLRDALYLRLAPERRAALHQLAADAVGERSGPAVEVAHHLLLAGEAVPEAVLLAALVAASSELVRVLAFDDAANLAQRALGARRFCERAECVLLTCYGSARVRAGQTAVGRKACGEAAAIARRLGDDELFARAALLAGIDFTPGAVDPELIDLLSAAARLELADKALAARVRARLAAAHQPSPEPAMPMRLAHEAVAMARASGDAGALMDVLAGATSALAYYEDPAVREPLDAELLELAERAGDRILAMRARVRLFYDELDRGRRERAEAHLAVQERLAESMRQPRFVWHAKLMRASLCAAAGDFAAADRLEAEAAELAGDDGAWPRSLVLARLERAFAEDRVEELDDLEQMALRAFDGDWFMHRELRSAIVARVRARRADRPAAVAALERLPAGCWAERHEMVSMAWLTEPTILAADEARARRLMHNMEPYADWHISCGPPYPMYGGIFARHLALLAAALGDGRAGSWFERALAHARAFGAWPLVLRLLVEQGEHRARLGTLEPSSLDEAVSLAERLGLSALAARARALLPAAPAAARGEASAPPSPAKHGDERAIRLRRDGDLWAVHFAGLVAHFRDSRGFQMLAALVAEPGHELTALALDCGRAASDASLLAGRGGVDALDVTAVKAYKARVADLREDLAEADARGDFHRAAALREEREALEDELARGLGLGGRTRKLAAPAERARINVQKRLKDAMGRIGAALPEAGRHLEATVRTGALCVYDPQGAWR